MSSHTVRVKKNNPLQLVVRQLLRACNEFKWILTLTVYTAKIFEIPGGLPSVNMTPRDVIHE